MLAYTPWGEIAHAPAGQAGYERVRRSDEQRVAPGSETLRALFGEAPALILLDELSVYLRKVGRLDDARGQLTAFLTSLFKAVESTPNAALVYTLAIGKDGRATDAYSTENQFVADRMAEIRRKEQHVDPAEARDQLNDRIRDIFAGKTFEAVAFPGGPFDVPDEVGDGRPKLVVFAYDGLAVGETVDEVPELIERVFANKGADGSALRALRNHLVFVAADEHASDGMRRRMRSPVVAMSCGSPGRTGTSRPPSHPSSTAVPASALRGRPHRAGVQRRGGAATLPQRVLPFQTVEAGEVTVRRAQNETVFDGERGQMRVGHEIRAAFRLPHQRGEGLLVAFRRQGNPDRLGGEPRLHLPPCRGYRSGAREDARVADDPHEREQAGPRQAYRRGGVDPFVEPLVRPRVLRERGHVRVDQQIGVDEDHRNSSPSATASTSATSSRLPARHRPRSTVGVR